MTNVWQQMEADLLQPNTLRHELASSSSNSRKSTRRVTSVPSTAPYTTSRPQPAEATQSTDIDIGTLSGYGVGEDSPEALQKPRFRVSNACILCRKLKMRCVPLDPSLPHPCKRCHEGGQECVFTKSERGRQRRPGIEMAKSLEKLESTLGVVLKSIQGIHSMPNSNGTLPAPAPIAGPSNSAAVTTARTLPTASFSASATSRPRGDVPVSRQADQLATARLINLPADSHSPLGLFIESSTHHMAQQLLTDTLQIDDEDTPDSSDGKKVANMTKRFANSKYFLSGRVCGMHERHVRNALLADKVISPVEVIELFDVYFTKCHLAVPILDPILHTASYTRKRSPFLFTTICTIAARYYKKADLYSKCLRYMENAAFDVISRGLKSPEICQALLLLVYWQQPWEQYEEDQDRTYQLSGLAIRMATELNLHQINHTLAANVSANAKAASQSRREILNQERVWMFCFIVDRAVAFQMGKPCTITNEDAIIRSSKSWYTQQESMPTDVSVSMTIALQRISSRISEVLDVDPASATASTRNIDYPTVVRNFLRQLDSWEKEWEQLCDSNLDENLSYVTKAIRTFYRETHRLYVLSCAVQHSIAHPDSKLDLASYCAAAFASASTVIRVVRDVLFPQDFFKCSPTPNFVVLGYACTSIVKFMDPVFEAFVSHETATAVLSDGVKVLDQLAVDETHTPALYAAFLRNILADREGQNITLVNSPTSDTKKLDDAFQSRASSNTDSSEDRRDPSLTPALPGSFELPQESPFDPWAFFKTPSHSRAPTPSPMAIDPFGFEA